MTLPATTVPVTLGPVAFSAGVPLELQDIIPSEVVSVLLINSTQAGTLTLSRVVDGVEFQRYTVAITGSADEDEVRYRNYGLQHRLRFVSLLAGTITLYAGS